MSTVSSDASSPTRSGRPAWLALRELGSLEIVFDAESRSYGVRDRETGDVEVCGSTAR